MDGVVEPRDVLSELPDDVLIRILSFLPTLDSARTMLLRRFGDLWTLVSTLHFDSFVFGDQDERFISFVRHVMLLHQAPVIHSFILGFNYDYSWDDEKDVVEEIQTWIKCALRKEPKLVALYFRCAEHFPLPLYFFPNQSLVDLTVIRCKLQQRRRKRVQMGSLRSLNLADVTMDESKVKGIEVFNEIISGCPSLEKLKFSGCINHDIVIHSKVLKELLVDHFGCSDFIVNLSCPNVKILRLDFVNPCFQILNISRVCKVSIHFNCPPEHLVGFYEDIKLLFTSLQNVEILTLCGPLLKDNIFPQNRWKTLTLTGIVTTEPCVIWISDLVRKSPMLEELTITTPEIELKSNGICPQLAASPTPSPCIAPHLRKVEICAGKNNDDQVIVQLIEFFLKSAVVLAELIISPNCIWGGRFSERKIKDLLKSISCFSKASTSTRIIID